MTSSPHTNLSLHSVRTRFVIFNDLKFGAGGTRPFGPQGQLAQLALNMSGQLDVTNEQKGPQVN